MNKILLDASAVLCLLHQEKGSESVAKELTHSAINTVNAIEVYSKLCEAHIPNEDIKTIFSELGIAMINFEQIMAYHAGQLRPLTKKYGLSLGDRACLATAICLNMDIITTDKIWQQLNLDIKITCIR